MAEYIERESVLALKKPFPTSKDSVTLYQQYFISPTAVEAIPAADVVPVVHGRWERKPDPHEFFATIPVCSACGGTTRWREEYLYCPNCGALMDKDGDGK